MTLRYILIGQSAVPEPDLLAWAGWMETGDCRVARSQIGPYCVSTVFLGIDLQLRDGPPQLFETMVFWAPGGELKDALIGHRSASWLDAEREHAAAIQACRVKGSRGGG